MPNKDDSSRPVSWEDLDKYLAGELDDINKREIECLLAEVPDSALVLKSQGLFEDSVASQGGALKAAPRYMSVAESWSKLAAKLGAVGGTTAGASVNSDARVGATQLSQSAVSSQQLYEKVLPVRRARASRFKVAAQLVSAAAVVAFAWFAGIGKVRNDLSTYASVYSTQPGRQASVTLPDGTDVVLNVGSRLEVGGDFLASNRKVKLTGQAKFNVKHNTGKPFSVETSTGTVTVLGTEFVVRDYAWDSLKTVSVWEGRVGFGRDIVSAGEQLSIASTGNGTQSVVKSGLDTTSNSFADGVLIVKDKRLEDILPELSAWYAVDIKFGDAQTRNRRISGRFELGSISELVEVLAWTLDVRTERNGDQITLYSK